jgi:hypothetical protein
MIICAQLHCDMPKYLELNLCMIWCNGMCINASVIRRSPFNVFFYKRYAHTCTTSRYAYLLSLLILMLFYDTFYEQKMKWSNPSIPHSIISTGKSKVVAYGVSNGPRCSFSALYHSFRRLSLIEALLHIHNIRLIHLIYFYLANNDLIVVDMSMAHHL